MRKGFTIVEFLIVMVVVGILVSCNRPDPKFHQGQTVRVMQTGEKVMILRREVGPYPYRYRCRISGPTQERRVGFIFEDTEITRYQIVAFREFELQRIGGRK